MKITKGKKVSINTQKMNNLRLYYTEYFIENQRYGSSLLANSDEDANKLAKSRGLNEVVIGSSELIDLIDKAKLAELIHRICFLSFIAIKSGKATPDQILSDKGVLHEAIHLLDGTFNDATLLEFNKKLDWLYEVTGSKPCITIPSSIFNT